MHIRYHTGSREVGEAYTGLYHLQRRYREAYTGWYIPLRGSREPYIPGFIPLEALGSLIYRV